MSYTWQERANYMMEERDNLREELDLVSEQRDMIAATADRYEQALQAIARACTDEDYPYIEATVDAALHWKDGQHG